MGSHWIFFGLHMSLLLSSVFILRELALSGFFNFWQGKLTTILLVASIIGYRCYTTLLRKKEGFSERTCPEEKSFDQDISNRRYHTIVIILILFVCFLGVALYTFIWLMNYGVEHQIMISYSEGIFTSICALSVYTIIRMVVNGFKKGLRCSNLC